MPAPHNSLLAGRNVRPLTDSQIRQVAAIIVALEPNVAFDYRQEAKTSFHVREEGGEEYGEIVIGPDIYPGYSSVDPNSLLGVQAAVAHELTHYRRRLDAIELPHGVKQHLDEALTSLEAIVKYERHLTEIDVRQLVSDAIQRIYLYLREELPPEDPTDNS